MKAPSITWMVIGQAMTVCHIINWNSQRKTDIGGSTFSPKEAIQEVMCGSDGTPSISSG